MTQNTLNKIETLFTEAGDFSPENVGNLIQETLQFFNVLKEKLESKDEAERAEALELAGALKTRLEQQAASLCESIGVDPNELDTYINDPENFSPEAWEVIEKAKVGLQSYKETAPASKDENKIKSDVKKRPKAMKEWLIS